MANHAPTTAGPARGRTAGAGARRSAPAPTTETTDTQPEHEVTASTAERVLATTFAAGLQAKLVVGAVDDSLEAEADRMADTVVARLAAAPAADAPLAETHRVEDDELLQGSRTPDTHRAKEDEEPLQGSRVTRSAVIGAEGGEVDADLEARLRAGGGSPLPEAVRAPMEQAFGADFSAVRIAENPAASEIGAAAYATGNDIVFAPGRFQPDSPAGQHLLAHELAHVVQQSGGAVQRERAEALADIGESTTTAAGHSDFVAGTVDDISAISEAEPVDLSTTDQSGTFGITGVAAGITGLVAGLANFYARMKDGSTEDQLVAAHESLESAGNIAKGAIDIASTAGATIVGTVVPGIDLAFSLLSAVRGVGQLVYLAQAQNRQGEQIDALQQQITAATGKGEDSVKLLHGLENIQTHTSLRIASTAIRLGGDITMAVGAAAQLATGPFGTAVKLAGALIKVSVAVGSTLMQHYEATKTNDARDNHALVMAVGTKDQKETATLDRLDNDAAFALHEIITQAAVAPDPAQPDVFDPNMLGILATYGIGEKWLAAWVSGGRDEGQLELAENRALRFIGAERDPKTIGQRIVATFASIKAFFTGTRDSTAEPATVRLEAAKQTQTIGLMAQGFATETPDKITEELKVDVVDQLGATHNPKDDPARGAEVGKAIDEGILAALSRLLAPRLVIPGTITVQAGAVNFLEL